MAIDKSAEMWYLVSIGIRAITPNQEVPMSQNNSVSSPSKSTMLDSKAITAIVLAARAKRGNLVPRGAADVVGVGDNHFTINSDGTVERIPRHNPNW